MASDASPATIRAALAQAAAFGISPPEIHLPKSEKSALKWLIDQIQGCILAHDLTILQDGTPCLTLCVSEATVVRVTNIHNEDARLKAEGILDVPLNAANVDQLGELALLIQSLLSHDMPLAVKTSRPATPPDPGQQGISAHKLAAALDLATYDVVTPNTANGFDAFLDAAADAVEGIYSDIADLDDPDCGPPLPAMLREKIGAWLSGDLPLQEADPEALTLMVLPDQPDYALGFATVSATGCALLCSPENAPYLASLWSAAHQPG